MFSKIALLATASLAVFVAAGDINNSCNTGDVQCCNAVYHSHTYEAGFLASLVGVDVNSITALVGANCSPLSVVGVAGNSCTQQPVCCTGNHFNGLVNVGCTPVNVNA